MTNDDDDYSELETRRRANRKSLALFGLVVVGGLLLYKCASQADRFGLGTRGQKEPFELSITIDREGRVKPLGCKGTVEDCVAQAKVHARNGEGSSSVKLRVEPGAPPALVREIEAMVRSFELTTE